MQALKESNSAAHAVVLEWMDCDLQHTIFWVEAVITGLLAEDNIATRPDTPFEREGNSFMLTIDRDLDTGTLADRCFDGCSCVMPREDMIKIAKAYRTQC
jgi:hypothetical protein